MIFQETLSSLLPSPSSSHETSVMHVFPPPVLSNHQRVRATTPLVISLPAVAYIICIPLRVQSTDIGRRRNHGAGIVIVCRYDDTISQEAANNNPASQRDINAKTNDIRLSGYGACTTDDVGIMAPALL